MALDFLDLIGGAIELFGYKCAILQEEEKNCANGNSEIINLCWFS
jgi:hypothetical protein